MLHTPRDEADARRQWRRDPSRFLLAAIGALTIAGAGGVVRVDGDWPCAALAAILGFGILCHHRMRTAWYLVGFDHGRAARR